MRDDTIVKHELVALMGVGVDWRNEVGEIDQAHVGADVTRKAGEFCVGREMVVHAQDAREIIEARVARAKRGGRVVRQRSRVSEPPIGAIENHRLPLGRAVAALAVVAELERAAALARDEVHHTADRRRSVKRAARAAHHLYTIEIVAGHVRDVEAAGRTAVDVDAIHEDQRLGRGRAANRNVGLGACRSTLVDLDAGHLPQSVARGVDLLLLDLMRPDNAHCRPDRVERLLHPRRCHHEQHFWQLATRLDGRCGLV